MPSGLDLLEGKTPVKKAFGSNLPPFDAVVPEGTDPDELAQKIVGTNGAKSGMDLLGATTPQSVSTTPKVEEPKVNIDAYDPTRIFGNIISRAQTKTPDNIVDGFIKPTLKAIPRVVTHTAASMQQMPISGISALAKFIATGGNLEAANKILEENQKALDDYYLTNPEEQKAAENIGLAMKPFQMAGEGLKDIVALTPLKNTIAEPIAATIGEAAAMFGFGGIRGAVKGRVDKAFKSLEDTIPGASGKPYSFGEFVKDTEPIVAKANELNKVQEKVSEIPDEALKAAYEKILEVEKSQLELEAKAVQDKIDHKKVVEEDLKARGQEVQEIKEGKAEAEIEVPSFDSDKEMLKSLGYEEAEIAYLNPEEIKRILSEDEIVEPLNELKQPQPATTGIDLLEPPSSETIWQKRAEKVEGVKFNGMQKMGKGKGELPMFTLDRPDITQTTFMVGKGETLEGAISRKYKEAEKAKVKVEPITDLDLQTGTPLPERLSSTNHPFRDKSPEHTETMRKLLQEKVNNVDATPEVFTRYLMNEVNRWLNGEEVPIDKVRNGLSELAARADGLKNSFDRTDDFNAWRGTIKEAARWARESDRAKAPQFNMGVDPTHLRDIIRNTLDSISNKKVVQKVVNLKDSSKITITAEPKQDITMRTEYGTMLRKPYGDTIHDVVARDSEGRAVGIAGVRKKSAEQVFYDDIVVDSEWKRKGVGDALLDSIYEIYKDKLTFSKLTKAQAENLTSEGEYFRDSYIEKHNKRVGDVDRLINKRIGGTQLNTGIDPTQIPEATKKIKELFKRPLEFFKEFDDSVDMKKFDLAFAIKQLKMDADRGLIDQSESLLKEVRRLYPKESQRVIDRQRSTANGKGYGEIEYNQMIKEVFDGKSDGQVRLINAYVLARRFNDIYGYRSGKEYKHQSGYGPDQTINTTSIIEMVKDIPEGTWSALLKIPEVKKVFGNASTKEVADAVRAGEALFEWHKKIVDDLVEAGLKTEAEGELLKAHDYRKFKTISVEKLYDFDYSTTLKGETIRSTNSGVDSLGYGSVKILDPDARLSAHEMAIRAYGSIANQAAKMEWKRLAEQYPDNQIVSTKQAGGWSPMPYFEAGVKKEIYFNPTAVKYLITRSHDVSNRASTIARFFTAAPLTRSLAVGTSPIWSTFIGLPMDVIHTLWSAKVWEPDATKIRPKLSYPFYETTKGDYKRVYSPYNPLTPLQLGKDMAETLTDVYTRGPLFENMAKHGLAMPFLSMRENRYVKGAKPPGDWAKLLDILSYHGVSMETWVRTATAQRVIKNRAREKGMSYEEALKNDDIMYEAVHSARDRMDYNQGGWAIKALDQNGMIFLNAALLGTRTFWRSAIENPVDFAVRGMQLTALATGITAMAWSQYEDIMKDIPTEGNEKNIVYPLFPGWLSFKDSNGDTRYFYAKLRMDPGAAFIYKMSDNLTRTYMYDRGLITREPNYNKVVDSLKTLGPIGVSLPPLVQMGYDYSTNYSWWQGRQMYKDLGGRTLPWPKSEVEGQDDNAVSQIAKDVGGLTKLSPKRLQGSISNVIPSNNEFVYMFGKAYEEAFSDVPEEARRKPFLQTLAEIPGFNRVIGITSPGYDRRQIADKINDEVELKKVVLNSKFDTMVENFMLHKVGKREDIISFINKQDKNTYEQMKTDFIFMEKSVGLEHRSTWLGMKRMSLEGKAKTFVEVYDKAGAAEKAQLDKEIGFIMSRDGMGIISDEFKQKVMQIRDERSRGVAK